MAVRAEALGFHSAWVADHIVLPDKFRSTYPYGGSFTAEANQTFFEPLVTLAYLAACTRSIRLGTSVLVVPIRNPVYTAKLTATLDALSLGRLILGVGAGWLEEEFVALGSDSFTERGTVLEEYMEVCRRLWTQELATFDGRHYRFDPVRTAPKPTQAAGPPIWIGGNSLRAMRRAAQVADGWQPTRMPADRIAERKADLRMLLETRGRDPRDFEVCGRCVLGIGRSQVGRESSALYGPAEVVAEGIVAYARAGCSAMIFDAAPLNSLDARIETMERFVGEVVPLLPEDLRPS
jgi:probable F420-dependent oxidoreductase